MAEAPEIKVQVTFTEVELIKLSLEPSDVLGVKITGGDIGPSDLNELNNQLKKVFPNNKVMIFYVPEGTEMEFTAIKPVEVGCGPQTCADCNCGKKEQNGT